MAGKSSSQELGAADYIMTEKDSEGMHASTQLDLISTVLDCPESSA